MRILFATKDVAAYNTGKPVVVALRELGHTVGVAAEGVSLGKWQKDGEPLLLEGTLDPIGDPYPFDPDAFLAEHRPEVMVIGFGHPMHLENKLALAAERLEIPCVWLENIWGASGRVHATPSLVFTNDEAGENMVRGHHAYKGCPIVRTGFSFLDELVVSDKERLFLEGTGREFPNMVLFAGGGPETVETFALTLASMKHEQVPFLFVPRFHPKYKDAPFQKECDEQLKQFAAAVPNCTVDSLREAGTDAIATFANVSVSAAGTVLLYSARHRRVPVNINLQCVRDAFVRHESPWVVFPGAGLGITYSLTESAPSLLGLVQGPRYTELLRVQDAYFAKPPMTSAEIAQSIVKHFS